MARARNIKPSIFKNEELGQIDPHITLLFINLWCLADRAGKLEDRPLRIKAETFPYRENIDINGYLTELERLGFIRRYVTDGKAVIRVTKFNEHQSPHNTEKPSVLPDEVMQVIENINRSELTVKQPLKNDGLTEAKRPESLFTDSLIPDSLNPENNNSASAIFEIFPNWKPREAEFLKLCDDAEIPIAKHTEKTLKDFISHCMVNHHTNTQERWEGYYAKWILREREPAPKQKPKPVERNVNGILLSRIQAEARPGETEIDCAARLKYQDSGGDKKSKPSTPKLADERPRMEIFQEQAKKKKEAEA